MTNEEQKLRGFAEKWGFSQDKTDEGFLIDNDRTKQCLSDLTSLISENYYPKEFTEWVPDSGYVYFSRHKIWVFTGSGNKKMTTDELFNYYKENIIPNL